MESGYETQRSNKYNIRDNENVVDNFDSNKTLIIQQKLTRLSITEHIHEYTPICVLMEIADAHGIKYDQKDHEKPNFSHHLIASIHQTSIPSIGEITSISDLQFIARFINKASQWPQNKLREAYNFLIKFMNNEDPLNKIPIGFTYGPQTPQNPFSINACILYKVCLHYRLNVTARTTIKQMAYAVKMLREDIDSLIRKVKIFTEHDAKRNDLINILMLSPHEIQDSEYIPTNTKIDHNIVPKHETSYDYLAIQYRSLNDISTLQTYIDPKTQSGSIALAAINYNIDISKSLNPIHEYKILKMSGRNDYKPSDPWMNYWYQLNPSIFDLSITFNPLFPREYYNEKCTNFLLYNEGYSTHEISSNNPYELLQMAYIGETFYQGVVPNIISDRTSIELNNIDEVPYGQLLSFGQMDSKFKLISMTELIGLFNTNKNFTNPFQSNSVFTQLAINKLKIIAQNPSGPIPSIRLSEDTIKIRASLLDAITGVEILTSKNDEPTRNFAFAYRNASQDTKDVIRKALTNLLNMGMYMRGWIGTGEYPVIRAPVPVEREPEVAVNVTNSIAQYEASCRSLGKLGSQLSSLPLVKYKDGQYQVSNDSNDGLTIGDRITIVKEGERTNNIASCIRLSSNWICASAHKYIISIGLPPPFDVFNLRYIS